MNEFDSIDAPFDAADEFDLNPRPLAHPAGRNVLFSTSRTFPSTSEGCGGGSMLGKQ
jgi:hypothetical protein